MTYLEMSRDIDHGGGTWAFTNCVWAPTKKRDGANWPFWEKVQEIQQHDIIIHLRGTPPNAYFVGYSVASGDGFQTTRRPPKAGEWDYADAFYRADLTGFTSFHQPINLTDVFTSRRAELESYFELNNLKGSEKLNVFFVRQSGRLQCLNGAYLSDIDEALLKALFGDGHQIVPPASNKVVISVETGSQIALMRVRIGQARFADAIKGLYGDRCCFPECTVSDARFLVGAHIARWSDNPKLRGELGNGLCLCLIHDRAFEIGLFTLDQHFRVFVNPNFERSSSSVVQDLLIHHGEQIRLASVLPLEDALIEHWIRTGIEP
ncbi:MAG TPA: HNH endonuclease [Acidobacteriaceae bacterium]|nr:HNH endonuclease [Acidobacteriaceae bacterium]